METSIIKIGNSQGLIIPKKLISTLGTSKQVDIQAKNGELVIRPLNESKVRGDWEKKFDEAIAKGFLPENNIQDFENEFDRQEWTW